MSRVQRDDTPNVPTPRETSDPGRLRRLREIRERARRRRALDLTWRLGVFMVGIAVIAGGAAMLVLPGPGWVAIILGLAVLATEFAWAERLLERVKEKVAAAADKAFDPRNRRRNIVIAAALAAVIVAVGSWYLSRYGFGLPF